METTESIVNRTVTSIPQMCVHEIFEEQVRRTPDAIALEYEGERLSYVELNRRANRLARHLHRAGVQAESRIALCLERGLDFIIATLAVLKAGGVYVPLDTAYPRERLRWMVEDARVEVLLGDGRPLSDVFGDLQGVRLIDLSANRGELAAQSSQNPQVRLSPENLAYLMYTSGSTGVPKGIGVVHQAIVRLVVNTDYVTLDERDAMLQCAAVSFDASTFEIWGSLLRGGVLVIAPAGRLAVDDLGELIEEREVSTLFLTASLFHAAMECGWERLKGVRQLLAGGESIAVRPLRKAIEVLPQCVFINGYGPTENTTFSAAWRAVAAEIGTRVPIGTPIANSQAHVLDAEMNPVSAGETGQLYVGGLGLARGYWDRRELTAERFIPNPFSEQGGERLYVTGDLAIWNACGDLEFLGRRDQQVKLRGYRIELEEVEAVLLGHPAVKQAAVLAREDDKGEKRLVAYVVSETGTGRVSSRHLRTHMQQRLPEYMVPWQYVIIPRMPLTANGKINRPALPEPSPYRPDNEYVAPRTSTEIILAGIWQQVLGLEKLGVNDIFFELGGHSLLAMEVVSRARKAFHVNLPAWQVFQTPTIAGLSAAIDDSARTLAKLPRADRNGRIQASSSQQRLWFLDQLVPGSAAYNIPISFRLKGRVNLVALEQSLSEIVRRHEVLRTTFKGTADGVVQVIHRPEGLLMRLIDLRGFTGERLEHAWEQVSRTEATRPFRLDSGPLLRVVCATLKDDEYGVLLTMHHIVSDGWSLDVLNEEATEFYKQFQLGAQAAPPELSIQCADLALWARTWLKSEAMERELAYWRRQLANMASLELPADRPAPAVPTFRGGTVEVELGAELANSLKELGRAEGATLFMTLLAAYDLLLHRYAGQEDIAVGIPIANRIREESEKLIGFFVNTLVVRATVDPSLSFRDLLRRVRDVAAAAYANQALPFDKVVEHLHPERAATSTPLFRAMFALQSPRQVTLLLEGATVLEQELETGTCRSDLTLSVFDSQDSLRIALVYSQDMFDRQTVERLLDTFHVLLGAVLKNPEMPVGFVPIVSEAEERRHRFEWNDSHREYPKEKTFHELFVESAERNADAIAAFSEGECVSYRALNLRANQLAHHLRRRGVRAESVVGICMEKSIDTLVGMLGIVKAGGAYLPLDPELPSQRLEFMLRDSSCACVLTESRLAANVPRTGAALICVDRDWSTIKRESAEKLAKYATSGNLAYIIYTSGTTGKPKGTTITHRSLVNYCCWVNEYLIDNADTELPAVTKLSFDASIKQLLAPLLRGDKVWLLPADIVLQPAKLLAKLAERENVGLNCVPSLWKALLDQSDSSRVPLPAGLNSLLVGGEQVSKESIARTLGKKPRLRIVNLYGPSEATANASSAALTADSAVTIGRPIANTTIYLLDGNLGLAPEGWPGKLYIGGDGLARGYLNRPDLTAAKFIPDPFSLTPGARLYDSGDLARHAPNGDVVFLGRADEQVKVHGFRIELSEIESVLRTHRAVKEAIALAIEREPGEKQLAAFLVARNGDKPGNSDLRSYLRQHLPDYMIPAGFTWLDHMPLTPSGKIDRLAVLGQSVSVAQPNKDRVTPRSEYEAAVASIWADVLGVERVDVHDDFFALGGHSILAMLVTSKLREMFSVDLPVHLLFIAPTVAELAAAVVDQINEQKSGALADCVVA